MSHRYIGLVLAGLIAAGSVGLLYMNRHRITTERAMPSSTTPSSLSTSMIHGDSIQQAVSGTTGVLITGTLYAREANQWNAIWMNYITAIDPEIVVNVNERLNDDGDVDLRGFYTRHNNLWKQVEAHANGDVFRQRGDGVMATLPSLLTDISGRGNVPDNTDYGRLLDYQKYPTLDWDVLNDLVVMGAISITEHTTLLGLPVTVFEVYPNRELYYPVTHLRLSVVDDTGIKAKVEEWYRDNTGEPDYRFEVTGIEFGRQVGDEYLTPEFLDSPLSDAEAETSYVESQVYDPSDGHIAPVAQSSHLLYPSVTPIHATFTLSSSVFITGTMEGQRMDSLMWPLQSDVGAGNRYWLVAQELAGQDETALILQGDDSAAGAPFDISWWWPPLWNETNVALNQAIRNRVSGVYHDGVEYDSYELLPQIDAQQQDVYSPWIPYDFLVTWKEMGDIRVVSLVRGLDREGAVELSSEFRKASGR